MACAGGMVIGSHTWHGHRPCLFIDVLAKMLLGAEGHTHSEQPAALAVCASNSMAVAPTNHICGILCEIRPFAVEASSCKAWVEPFDVLEHLARLECPRPVEEQHLVRTLHTHACMATLIVVLYT